MTTNYQHLRIDADFPGVETVVTQHVDFGLLTPAQLRRCVRAVERGHTARGGYVAALIRAAAKQLGVSPPLTFDPGSVWPLPKHKYETAFADLIKLSDVRHKMYLATANLPDYTRKYEEHYKSGWTSSYWSQEYLQLHGWRKAHGDLKREIEKVLRATDYYTDLKRLAEFIATAPRFPAP